MAGYRIRDSILIFLLAAVLAVLPVPLARAVADAYTAQHVTLTWTDKVTVTQTITWKTESSWPVGKIMYAEKADSNVFAAKATVVTAVSRPLPADGSGLVVHVAALTGLKPDTTYMYRLGDGDSWSRSYWFTTAPADTAAFRFLVFGDSQSDGYENWGRLVRQAYRDNPQAAFLTVVGDLVDVGADYSQWREWFDAAEAVISNVTIMPLTGNHETYTPVWGERTMPVLFTAQFKLPANGPDGLQGLVYSFDYGDAHFVILDSQEREEARFIPDMLARQQAWLDADLAATAKRWKIVLLHKTPYPVKSGRSNESVKAAFVPLFDKHRVDVVISGHDHVYARTYPLTGDKITAGGTIYVTAGRSGAKAYQYVTPNELHEFFYNPFEEPNYLVVEVGQDKLSVKTVSQSGQQIDSWQRPQERTQEKIAS
jgi:3',5'-cyclic AMP phosphodiesterase CpdA